MISRAHDVRSAVDWAYGARAPIALYKEVTTLHDRGPIGRSARRSARGPRVDPIVIFDALERLRAAEDLQAPHLRGDWLAVNGAIGFFAESARMGLRSDRADAHQRALMRVQSAVRGLEASAPAAGVAWLRTIFHNALVDILRDEKRRRELFDGAAEGRPGRPRLEELPAKPVEDARIHDPSALAPFKEALFDFVEEFTSRMRPQHRSHALIKAQLAYRWVIEREPMETIHEDAGGASRDTLHQWLRRGRVNILVPALEAWLETLGPDTPEHSYAVELSKLLAAADRADAGQARPDRRKKSDEAGVSHADHCKSAQCDDEEDDA